MNLDIVFNITLVLTIVQMIPMLVMVWIGIIAAGGLLKKKHSNPVLLRQGRTDFGIIICAHNEENAIGSLFESIAAQDYDKKKIQVFLLADRCTDDTVRVGEKYPFVTVFERQDGETRGKGAVLHWGLEQILKTEEGKKADAFAVIDADNVLKADFLSQMDRKLREGNPIVQGNRLGGQPYRSIVTKWYTWTFSLPYGNRIRSGCGDPAEGGMEYRDNYRRCRIQYFQYPQGKTRRILCGCGSL